MNKKKLRGFTLIELIVVLAIVAALAAILIPTMIGYTRQARAQTAIANAKTFTAVWHWLFSICTPMTKRSCRQATAVFSWGQTALLHRHQAELR